MTELEEIRTWDIEKLWNFISIEQKIDRKTYELVRFGNGVKMDINDFIRNAYIIKNKSGKVFYRGKVYWLEDLYTDIESRRREAFRWIEKNFPERRVVGARMAPKE